MSSDDRLARRAARGDRRAFAEIYRRYDQDLYRFCLAMVGNPQDAQDTLQNTMVKVLRGLPGEERTIQLKPWLYRIARNESIETLRKRRESSELEPQHAVAVGVTETAETRERLRTLLADLEVLPERQRSALVMRELAGLGYDQIGAAFGTSAAVARQTLYEARLSLRQLEAGREMRCAEVMRKLSDADGRVTRRRELRAHLRGCADCRAFRDGIGKRHEDLAALGPLPVAASAALLNGVLVEAGASGGAAAGGVGLGGSLAAGAGQVAATSVAVKSAATVAIVAVVGMSAGDRSGLIDVPFPGKDEDASAQSEQRHAGANGGEAERSPAAAQVLGQQGDEDNDRRESASPSLAEGKDGGEEASKNAPASDPNPSSSQQGLDPPGGGHGRAATETQGQPDALPAAAENGQQNAAGRKPDHAASPPGGGAPGNSEDGSPGGGAPSAKPSPPPQAQAQNPPTLPAAPELPPQAGKGAANAKTGAAGPPGLDG
jgi:RNA polymerase sigma factor (sigma-70 family)